MTPAASNTRRPDDGTRQPRSRLALLTVTLPALTGLALLGAGCGGSGSPAVANVASTTTTTATTTPTATPATTTQRGPGGIGSADGGSSPAGRSGGSHTVIMVGNAVQGARFAVCMRAHGVPNLPDPNSQGLIQFSGIDPHSSAFASAMHACRQLLPQGLAPPTAAQLAQVQQQLLAFSACMRARGITDFPDPSGAALPQVQPTGDLDPNNPHFQTAYTSCKGHLPAGPPPKALGGLAPPS